MQPDLEDLQDLEDAEEVLEISKPEIARKLGIVGLCLLFVVVSAGIVALICKTSNFKF